MKREAILIDRALQSGKLIWLAGIIQSLDGKTFMKHRIYWGIIIIGAILASGCYGGSNGTDISPVSSGVTQSPDTVVQTPASPGKLLGGTQGLNATPVVERALSG
jgi:hypothetical protein